MAYKINKFKMKKKLKINELKKYNKSIYVYVNV